MKSRIGLNRKFPPSRGSSVGIGGENRRVSVGVLVDLRWGDGSGGQVKCWERFAEAARSVSDELDLTVHFQGDREGIFTLSRNVRYVTLPPVFSTARFHFMDQVADHADLSPLHPNLLTYLRRFDVIHTTDAFFAYARTAGWVARRWGVPLVNSIHTDTPSYTRIYSGQVIRRIFHDGPMARLLLRKLRMDDRCADLMKWRLKRFLGRCRWVFVSNADDLEWARRLVPRRRVSFLRRGVDVRIFNPVHRDRDRLASDYGIDHDRFVILFVGRVDEGKNVMVLGRAAEILIARGLPVHVLALGEGAQRDALKELLGPRATCPGVVSHPALAECYAGADAFVFPSTVEVMPNAVLEAKSSGLPVLLPARGAAARLVKEPGGDGILVDDQEPETWARALENLMSDEAGAKRIGRNARRMMEEEWPTWSDVLREDLLPFWRRAAGWVPSGGWWA